MNAGISHPNTSLIMVKTFYCIALVKVLLLFSEQFLTASIVSCIVTDDRDRGKGRDLLLEGVNFGDILNPNVYNCYDIYFLHVLLLSRKKENIWKKKRQWSSNDRS